jgi:hypothetical protein
MNINHKDINKRKTPIHIGSWNVEHMFQIVLIVIKFWVAQDFNKKKCIVYQPNAAVVRRQGARYVSGDTNYQQSTGFLGYLIDG